MVLVRSQIGWNKNRISVGSVFFSYADAIFSGLTASPALY